MFNFILQFTFVLCIISRIEFGDLPLEINSRREKNILGLNGFDTS